MWQFQTEGFKAGMLTKQASYFGEGLIEGGRKAIADDPYKALGLAGLLGAGAGGLGMKYYMGDKAKDEGEEAPIPQEEQTELTPEQLQELIALYSQDYGGGGYA